MASLASVLPTHPRQNSQVKAQEGEVRMIESTPTTVEIPAVVELPANASLGTRSIAPDTTAEQDRASASERLAARTVAPKTTEEEDRHTASQRRVNMVWEYTQSAVALLVTATTLGICVALVARGNDVMALQLMSSAFFLIIGFYFGRTNHQRVGGVELPYQPHQGR